MSLALNYCWKEWRAQRGLLIAYALLVFSCLCLALYLAPRHYWFEEGFGVHALSWFVTAGVIGVVGFVVPGMVRAEFTTKQDQFVRRLPGALWPAFLGKLLFLVLAAVALPLIGLLAGEVFVTSLEHDWKMLFVWEWNGTVRMVTPEVIYFAGLAMLLVPWIWAAGTWTPGGRLALLATLLLGLLLCVGVYAVVRQSPQIVYPSMLTGWLWVVPTSGLLVAAASWCIGRRGGGAWRSARFGLLATSLVVAPFATWLGNRAMHYHYPDYSQLEQLSVEGITPDGRYLLAQVAENENWFPSAVRVDLHSGEAMRVGGPMIPWQAGVVPPWALEHRQVGRFWRNWRSDERFDVFDLQTAERRTVDYDQKRRAPVLPLALREAAQAERIASSRLRDRDGRRVWLDDGHVYFESEDGSIERVAWEYCVRAAGVPSGLGLRSPGAEQCFDFVRRQAVPTKATRNNWFVGRSRLFNRKGHSRTWYIRRGDEEPRLCEPLDGVGIMGLFDEQRLLVRPKSDRGGFRGLALFTPDTGDLVELNLPADMPDEWLSIVTPMSRSGSIAERDPHGCVWLRCILERQVCFARIDAATLEVSTLLPHVRPRSNRNVEVLSWQDLPTVLLHDGLEIVRVNIETGERVTVFDGGRGKPEVAAAARALR